MHSPTPGRATLKSTALAWAVLLATNLALAQIPKPTDAPRPMTPEQSAAAFKLPDGFRMEVVASEPDIVFLADRDGDGKAETRDVLFTGFPTGELERGINAPQWGADGWIYFGRGWGGGKITGPHLREPVQLPGSDFRIRADGSAIEPVTGATHTFGFAMTESGDRFTVTTSTPGIFKAPLT